jgi:hypothetical protein
MLKIVVLIIGLLAILVFLLLIRQMCLSLPALRFG